MFLGVEEVEADEEKGKERDNSLKAVSVVGRFQKTSGKHSEIKKTKKKQAYHPIMSSERRCFDMFEKKKKPTDVSDSTFHIFFLPPVMTAML